MPDKSLYSSILGLSSQWRISNAVLDSKARHLRLEIAASSCAEFCCPVCGGAAVRVGANKGCWQHDDLLNMRFHISAVIPVTLCKTCGTNRISVPWERAGSCFRCME